ASALATLPMRTSFRHILQYAVYGDSQYMATSLAFLPMISKNDGDKRTYGESLRYNQGKHGHATLPTNAA
ncbi:hypothetical protein, partial [uncultured Ellagibacter sp.]|uniref:hypothetical protein n=1 Tax=uncultured Ellagibacter sp. TaxID=2137580 RepID=UPI0025CC9E00